MDTPQFNDFAKSMVDFIGDYFDNIRDRRVLPAVTPGYLRPLLPERAPETPDRWQDVMADIERVIMPGISCPANSELENVMLDWLGLMMDLPKEFLFSSRGKGGALIEGSASESTFVALLGAKNKKLNKVRENNPDMSEAELVSKLVAYCSNQAHSSVPRAAVMAGVAMRQLETDDLFCLRGETLREALEEDLGRGLIPFYVVAALGTTSTCSFDHLEDIGPLCARHDLWLHVDAAYAGAAFICPEFRPLMAGIEHVDSFNMSPHKWLFANYDCAALWLRDMTQVRGALNVDPQYLRHDQEGGAIPDLRHYQVALGRRFRSLKLWFLLRLFGVRRLQEHVRRHVVLARLFAMYVGTDARFELVCPPAMGLVCFRIKGSNKLNEDLLKLITDSGKIFIISSKIRDVLFLRLVVSSPDSEPRDIELAWTEVRALADHVLATQDRRTGETENWKNGWRKAEDGSWIARTKFEVETKIH